MKEKIKLLISQINQLHEKDYFHLLPGNLLFLIEIFKYYHPELENLHDNLITILRKFLPEIDRQAEYYYWRETLHKALYNLYEVIPAHLQNQLVELLENNIRAGKENPYNPIMNYESWDISNQLTQALDKAELKNDFTQIFAALSICLFKTLYPYHTFLEQNNLASFDEWVKTRVLIDNILILQWLEPHENKAEYKRLFYRWLNLTMRYLEKDINLVSFENSIILLEQLLSPSEQQSPCLHAAALFYITIIVQRYPQYLELMIAKICEINNKQIDSVLLIPPDQNNDNRFSLLKLSQHQRLQRLPQMRKVFSSVSSVAAAQKQFSQETLMLLKTWLHEAAELLGKPPTQISLGILGSSSRKDRMPYSDVELFCLHGEVNDLQVPQLGRYLDTLLRMLELKIISQNETPRPNSSRDGFRIDSTTHLLTKPHLIGTPRLVLRKKLFDKYHFVFMANNIIEMLDIINKNQIIDTIYAIQLVNDLTEDIEYLQEFIKGNLYTNSNALFDNLKLIKKILLKYLKQDISSLDELLSQCQKLIELVPQLAEEIIDDESFFSLLQPIFIDLNGKSLAQTYSDAVNGWLDTFAMPAFTKALMKIVLQKDKLPNKSSLLVRHNIALFCYGDILQKSNADVIVINAGTLATEINLKRDYYKPLAYLGICLRLFHRWEVHTHPIDLFEQAHKQNALGHAVSKLLQCALIQINRLRSNAHSEENKQQEIILPETELAKKLIDFKAHLTLTIIRESILEPLKQSFLQALSAIEEFNWQKVCASILPAYLKQRRHYYDLAKAQQLQDQCELLNILADFPGPDGWSPTSETQWNTWLATVRTLFLSPEQSPALSDGIRCIISGYPTLFGDKMPLTTFHLPAEIVAQRFDKSTGEVIGNPDYSSSDSDPQRKHKPSKVFTYVWENQTLFFRFKEGNRECLLGHEIAVEMLHRLLGGRLATAPGWPLKLSYIPSSGEPKIHWCWVSLGINGENLGRAMLTDAGLLKEKQTTTNLKQKKLNNIDPVSFSQLFILSLLTFPEDGQPWNFLLEEFGALLRLVAIDNGHNFVNPWETIGKGNLLKLNLKTMLFLLPNFIQPLAAEVVEWISQLNIDQIIDNWRKYIQQINFNFQPLIEKDLKAARIAEGKWEKLNKLIVVLDEQIEFVRFRLHLIQNWSSRHPNDTAQALASFLDPLVVTEYAKYQGKIKTPKDYYAISPNNYVIKPLLRNDIQQHCQASSRNFQALLNNSLQIGYIQLDKEAQANYINHIKSIRFEGMSPTQQRFFLKLMEQLSFSGELSLAHCSELTDATLETILKKSPELTSINISFCSKITEKSWLNIGGYCKNIKYINLAGNKKIKKLEKNIFRFNNFKLLEIVDISDCQFLRKNIDISLKNVKILNEKSTLEVSQISERSTQNSILSNYSMDKPYDYSIKITLISHGGGVGKSSCLGRFIKNTFEHSLIATIGVDVGIKFIEYNGKIVRAQFWDTSGTERFKEINRPYVYSAHALIIMMDIVDGASLNSTRIVIDTEVRRYLNEGVPILLVANKCDLKNQRQFTYVEGLNLAHEIGAFNYIECSAKVGTNVEAAFTLAAKAAVDKYHKGLSPYDMDYSIRQLDKSLTYKFSLKILLTGFSGAGKSSWLHKLVENVTYGGHPTCGVDLKKKVLEPNYSIFNLLCKVLICEVTGINRFIPVTKIYYPSKEIIILFIDLTRPLTENLTYLDNIKKYADKDPNILVVGNKVDLFQYRLFNYATGVKYAESIGAVKYIECSVITGHNLNEIFLEAANLAVIKKLSFSGISEDKKIELKKTLEHSDIRLRQLAAETLINLGIYDEQIKQVFKQNLHTDIPDIWYSAKKALEKLNLLASDDVLNILAEKIPSNNEFIAQTAKELFHQYKTEKTACQFLIIARLLYQLLRNPYTDHLTYLCCNEIINKIIDHTFDALNQPNNIITVQQRNSIKTYASHKSILLQKHNKQQFLEAIGCFSSSGKLSVSNENLPIKESYVP